MLLNSKEIDTYNNVSGGKHVHCTDKYQYCQKSESKERRVRGAILELTSAVSALAGGL